MSEPIVAEIRTTKVIAEIRATGTVIPVVTAPPAESGGVTDHRLLTHRDAIDQHPIEAIVGLAAVIAALGSRNAPDGYAGLTAAGLLLENQIPASIARDSEVTSALAGKAPLEHAARHKAGGDDEIRLDELGAPTAPVAAGSQRITGVADPTNDQDAATRAWVLARLAELVGEGTPSTLDTLLELAAALGNDPNFATTVATAIGEKIAKTVLDPNTIIKADEDSTPVALTVGEGTLVGRVAGGVIAALSSSQVRTLLSLVPGTDVAQQSALAGKATIVNTDGDPGTTVFVGSVDPTVDHMPEVGDVWIEVPS